MDKYIIEKPFRGHAENIIRNGELLYRGNVSVEQYLASNENLLVVNLEEYNQMLADLNVSPFKEITEEQYEFALCQLPPLKWRTIKTGVSVFFNPEADMSHYHSLYLKDSNRRKFFKAVDNVFATDAKICAKYEAEVLNNIQ